MSRKLELKASVKARFGNVVKSELEVDIPELIRMASGETVPIPQVKVDAQTVVRAQGNPGPELTVAEESARMRAFLSGYYSAARRPEVRPRRPSVSPGPRRSRL